MYEKLTTNHSPSSKSLCCVAKEEGLLYSTTHHVTVALNLHPYPSCVIHGLLPSYLEKCERYCRWFLKLVETDLLPLYDIFYPEEASFLLSGHINSQNDHVWSTTNPHVHLEALLHTQKLYVWCAISGRRMIGLIFFTETITCFDYIILLM